MSRPKMNQEVITPCGYRGSVVAIWDKGVVVRAIGECPRGWVKGKDDKGLRCFVWGELVPVASE